MKKNYLFGTFAVSLLALGACSSNDEPTLDGFVNDPDAQQIMIQVSNAEEALDTRAGRPLLGSEAKQTIENVRVIITDADGNVVYVNDFANWTGTSTAYTTNGHGRQTILSLTGNDRLEAGKAYKIYAIGYHSNTDYNLTAVTSIAKGGTFKDNAKISLKPEATDVGEEIFAGSINHTVNSGEHAGFQINVVLNRQVAGAYGYFSAVPYVDGAAKLRLVANTDLNSDLILGGFRNTLLYQNGTNNLDAYVINAATPKKDTKVIYEINLADWYGDKDGNIKDEAHDGLIDATTWKQPESFGKTRIFKTGTCFGGNFVLPFAHSTTASTATLELELTDAAGKVLRAWPVKLGEGDKLRSEHSLYSWNGTAFSAETGHSCGETTYNVVRNHLYGLGTRVYDNGVPPSTTDPDPDKTLDDKDDPEPLNTKEQLTLRVNDNWEVLHQMGLGDPYTPAK